MELQQKLDLLGAGAGFDVDEAAQVSLCATAGKPLPNGRTPAELGRSISMLTRSDGKKVPILKVLQTSACAKDCYYCPFRAGRDFRRAAFTPEELARATDQLYRAGRIQGLFLSSGIVGKGEYSQERIVATAEILRRQYEFRGYLHLKLMPNASAAAVERSMQLADRVSVNLEAPTPAALERLSGTKDLDSLLNPLRLAASLAPTIGRRVSHVTQFVVGPGGETDRDLLRRTDELYRKAGLWRAYYSAFSPVPNTPLDGLAPTDPRREAHLYQADFLMRLYGFDVAELPFDGQGRLPGDRDPKQAWADARLDLFPLEVNLAPRELLLRVPGIGPTSAERVVAARRVRRIRSVDELAKLGVTVSRAVPYILLDGKVAPRQLALFS